jgi:type VI secretion system protein ImpC
VEAAMPEEKAAKGAAEAQKVELGLLDQIVDQGRLGRDAAGKARGKDMVKQFISEVLAGSITMARDTEAMLNARIAQIDQLVSLQLNEVLHHPDFQKLEGTWRGLRYLLTQSETGEMLKVKVLNISKKELLRAVQEGL